MSASPLCHGCKEPSLESELFAVAVEGELVRHCARCFYCREIAALCTHLSRDHSARELVTDGLSELYTVIKAAVEEDLTTQRATGSIRHAAESESEGQGASRRRRR